jgi:hypothetical protein
MKNNLFKYYIAVAYLCSTFVMVAQDPGTTDSAGLSVELDGDQTPGAPVDDYVWLLALVGLIFVFMKFKAMQKSKVNG